MRTALLVIATAAVFVAGVVGGWAGVIFAGVVVAVVIAGVWDEHHHR